MTIQDPLTQEQAALLALLVGQSFRYSEEGFKLTSGKTSKIYVDCKQTTLGAQGAALCGTLLFELLKGHGLGAVGGLTLGADPLVTAISLTSWQQGAPMDAIIVRKEPKGHGTGRWVEGPADKSLPVAVVDDVITTGKSTVQAVERLREAGYNVVRAVAVVDRNEGGREAVADLGLALDALFTIDDILAHYRSKA